MIDDSAKKELHDELKWVRQELSGEIVGLSEYEIRRPLTRSGTNLLGLVKHLTLSELVYLGAVFLRPSPEKHPSFGDPGFRNRDSLWVSEGESTADIVAGYKRACSHADATIATLPLDAPARVSWWPRPETTLLKVMIHVVTETSRHTGHADILREHLRGATDTSSAGEEAEWAAHCERVELAARAAR